MKTIFKSLFLFLAFTLFINASNCAYAREVKFVFITDTNINKYNAYKLKETIKEINSYRDIDFVVFGGNNIQKANINNLNYFLYLFKKVHKRKFVLLGNQDVLSSSGIDKKYYMKRVKRASHYIHSGKPNYIFKSKGYVFVAMDGSKQYFQSSNGYYNKEELMWLENTLNKYKNKKVVILQHFPLTQTSSKWLQTPKTEEYFELLSRYSNVKAIISGHYNSNEESNIQNISHIVVENYPKNQSYKIIQMDLNNNFIGTYLVK